MVDLPWPEFRPGPPPELAGRLPRLRADRWLRMQAGLWLLAATGWAVVPELAAVLQARFGLRSGSGSLKRLFRSYLPAAGLAVYDVLPLFRSGLAVVRLSGLGEELCGTLGWPVVEAEWARLIRLHEGDRARRHTAMVLAFAHQARRRGYRVQILPEVDGLPVAVRPDLFVQKGEDRAYVEVERGRAGKLAKWRNLEALQGFVAAVVLTPQRRRSLVDGELARLGIAGQVSDLQSLLRASRSGEPGPLWGERW